VVHLPAASGAGLRPPFLKDSEEDTKKVRQYFEVVIKNRAKRSHFWKSFYKARGILGG
jgi:hypothetical protein